MDKLLEQSSGCDSSVNSIFHIYIFQKKLLAEQASTNSSPNLFNQVTFIYMLYDKIDNHTTYICAKINVFSSVNTKEGP